MPAGVFAASPRVVRRYFREAAILFRKSKGVQLASVPNLKQKPPDRGGSQIWVVDPSGNLVELF